MSPVAGPFFAAVLVLALAGALKVARPDPTRVALRGVGLPSTTWAARGLGAAELAIAALALVRGDRASAALVAAAYLGFAGFSALARRRGGAGASCGCFGATDAPVTSLHVGIDLAIAAVAVLAVARPVAGLVDVARGTPWAGVPFVAFTLLLAWLVEVALTLLPELLTAGRPAPRAVR
jgi:hypothetical protein